MFDLLITNIIPCKGLHNSYDVFSFLYPDLRFRVFSVEDYSRDVFGRSVMI